MRGNCAADQRFCFRYIHVDSTIPLLLISKFQVYSHLWLYSPVCVGPGWKPWRQVFSWYCSFYGEIPLFCGFRFPLFYMLDANLKLLLNGEVTVVFRE